MKISIKANARNLIIRASEEVITIADDIKSVFEPVEGTVVRRKIEITNGVDYSKEDALKIVGKDEIATKWINTIEDDVEQLVIVLEK